MPLPSYPPDWSAAWTGLQRHVRTAYTAARTRVRFAAIRAAGILIGGGGSLQVMGPREHQRMLYVGRDEEGTSSRLWLGRPKDGSAVLDLRAAEGEYGQWALRDQQGEAVVAEGPEGIGLARPVMPVATTWVITRDGISWDARSETTSWQSMIHAWAVFQHTAVTFFFLAQASYTGGQIRLLVDGQEIDTRSLPKGEPGPIRTERFVVEGERFLNYAGPVRVELHGRCTEDNPGGQAVFATALYNEGAGTTPEAEPPQ